MANHEALLYAIDNASLVGMEDDLLKFYHLPASEQRTRLREVYLSVKDKPWAKEIVDMYEGVLEGCEALRTHSWNRVDKACKKIENAVKRRLHQIQNDKRRVSW
jgi:hypothetical protein